MSDSAEAPLLDPDVLASMDELGSGRGGVRLKLWKLFAEKAPEGMDELLAALEAGTASEDLSRLAHALKSMALTAGAARFAAVLQALESRARENDDHAMLERLAHQAADELSETLEGMQEEVKMFTAGADAA